MEKNSDLFLLQLNLQLRIHEQGVDKLDAALALALQIERAHQASKVLLPSHPQQWTSSAAGVFPGSCLNVLPQTVPTSPCSTMSTLLSAVHSASSGDFMKRQRTLESFTERVDQLQLDVNRKRYASRHTSSPDRQRRSLTPDDSCGRTSERLRYDRHSYTDCDSFHKQSRPSYRDTSGDRDYYKACRHDCYRDHSPRMSPERGQRITAWDTLDRASCSDSGRGDRSLDGYILVSKSWSCAFPVSFTCSSAPEILSVVDNEGQLPAATDTGPIGNVVEHHVISDTGQAVTQNVSLVIEDTVVHAVIDTGADVSLISEEFRISTPTLRQRPLVKQFIPLTSIFGDTLDSVGTLSANVTLGKRTVSHSFQVIRNCSKALVLGWDFLSMHKIVINMQNMSFQLGEDSIFFGGVDQHSLKLVDVTVCTTTVVPALSEAIITAKPNGYTGVFEPYYREDSKIGFAWTVTKADKGSIYVKMVNPSADDISLHCGTPIGTFHSISKSDQDGFVIIEKSVNNVNAQNVFVSSQMSMPKSLALPDLSNTELSVTQMTLLFPSEDTGLLLSRQKFTVR